MQMPDLSSLSIKHQMGFVPATDEDLIHFSHPVKKKGGNCG